MHFMGFFQVDAIKGDRKPSHYLAIVLIVCLFSMTAITSFFASLADSKMKEKAIKQLMTADFGFSVS